MSKNDASRDAVKEFLDLLQSRLRFLSGIVSYDPRAKNRDFLTAMEWKSSDREKWLLAIVPDDYYEGPLPNSDEYADEIWVFGKLIQDQLCYIKVCFIRASDVLCISFHFAEHDMFFPLSGKTIKKTYEDK